MSSLIRQVVLCVFLIVVCSFLFNCKSAEQDAQAAAAVVAAAADEALSENALAPGAKPGASDEVSTKTFSSADFAEHIKELRKVIPAHGFTVVVQAPFVVIGDEPAFRVRQRATATVKWATDKLKQDYFPKDPQRIIDIWLFKDRASYRKYTEEIFHDRPDTPFGYFSERHNALIMNIGTGGGTLVHEMVHAFMKPNFPRCPAWFNEGLASLYEQCHEVDGRIMGLTNWRLASLQEAISARKVPSFKQMVASSSTEFYNEDKGTNYAQARYLCYYLQEQGKLREFYREFLANQRKDPTGWDTLQCVLDEKDMPAFQKRWEDWVLKLTFDGS
jgi:hypothetical protein